MGKITFRIEINFTLYIVEMHTLSLFMLEHLRTVIPIGRDSNCKFRFTISEMPYQLDDDSIINLDAAIQMYTFPLFVLETLYQ